MSDLYGPADRMESIATIHAALDAGVTLIDSGDFYASGHNEFMIRETLAGRNRSDVVLSVKFGALRDPGGGWVGVDNSPAVLAQGNDIVPLVGARTRERLAEALGALDVELSAEDLAEIARAIPADAAAGERYDAHQMSTLDSERGGCRSRGPALLLKCASRDE
jgi:aryl-alcohol dehydrogenase-like predicted oxidoreductase